MPVSPLPAAMPATTPMSYVRVSWTRVWLVAVPMTVLAVAAIFVPGQPATIVGASTSDHVPLHRPLTPREEVMWHTQQWRQLAKLASDYARPHSDIGFPAAGPPPTAGSSDSSHQRDRTTCVQHFQDRLQALLDASVPGVFNETTPAMVEAALATMLLDDHYESRRELARWLDSPQPVLPFLDAMSACMAANPVVSVFACEVMDDVSLQPALMGSSALGSYVTCVGCSCAASCESVLSTSHVCHCMDGMSRLRELIVIDVLTQAAVNNHVFAYSTLCAISPALRQRCWLMFLVMHRPVPPR